MSIGISVNVGLNKVTSTVFRADPLGGCENDARAMREIAINQGFESDPALSQLLIGNDASLEKVVNAVKVAAEKLQEGDLFLFTFAGHGTFKVVPAAAEETDRHDESIVLNDHLLLDNCWRNELWPMFKPGVRVVAIADCCHSESALVSGPAPSLDDAPRRGKAKPVVRGIAEVERQKEMLGFPDLYAKQLEQTNKEINCTRIFLAACLDRQKASDGPEHGAFTDVLLKVWNNGSFAGNYIDLIKKIKEPFENSQQTPNLSAFGSPDFSTEKPFKI